MTKLNTCEITMNSDPSNHSSDKLEFLDLSKRIRESRKDLDAAYIRVMDSGQFILGEEVARFEEEFAKLCGAEYALAVGNGLDALTIVLRALEIGPGDEVLVPAHTHVATWLAVSAVGARIIPVEPDPRSFNIDPERAAQAVTSKTAAILAVHMYGQPSDMHALRRLADHHGLKLIVDAAQAAGAGFVGERGIELGDCAAFSFYPTKNLGALGDGGAIVTNDPDIVGLARRLRNYGSRAKNYHELKGVNSRLDELQAAFLRCHVRGLEDANRQRRSLADRYVERLAEDRRIHLPVVLPRAVPTWHLFTVQVRERDDLQRFLREGGIESAIYYPVPPHLSPAYADERRDFPPLPITEALARSVLSLPLQPYLQSTDVDRVCDRLAEWNP